MNNRPSMDLVVASGILFIGCVVARQCKLWYPKANNHNKLEPSRQVSSEVVSWNIPSSDITDNAIVQMVDFLWNEESKNDLQQTPEDSIILFGSDFSDGESCTSRGSSVVYHDSVTNESLSSVQGESSISSSGVPTHLHIDQSASPRQDLAYECCNSRLLKPFSQSDEELTGRPMIKHSLSVSSSTSPSLLNKHWSPRMSVGSPTWKPYIIEKMSLPKDNTASSRRNCGCSIHLRQKYHARLRERRIRESKNNHWLPYSPPRTPQTSISEGLRETNQQAPGSPIPELRSRSASVGAGRRNRSGRRTVNAWRWTSYRQTQGAQSIGSARSRNPDEQLEISESHSCVVNPQ